MNLPLPQTARQLFAWVFIFALALTLSAFFMEHVLHAIPCKMCWWQRYTHWALGLFALGAWLTTAKGCSGGERAWLALLVLTALVSGGIGLYQGLGQIGWVTLPASCTGSGLSLSNSAADLLTSLQTQTVEVSPPCDKVNFTIFGLSLAWWNVIAMLAFLAALGWAWRRIKTGQKK